MMHRVLVPLDGSARAETALPHAATIARIFGADLYVLRVIDRSVAREAETVDSLAWRLAQVAAGSYVDRMAADLASQGHLARAEVVEGRAAEEIVRFVARAGIDLVVLATHGEGAATDFSLGGTARKVADGAGVSVMLVPSQAAVGGVTAAPRYRRILAPVDCSPRSEWGASVAAVIAAAHEAELLLTHIVVAPQTPPAGAAGPESELARGLVAANRAAAGDYLEKLGARLASPGLHIRSRIEVAASPSEALARITAEEKADLTVLCAHGATGSAGRPYGSVAAPLLASPGGVVIILQDIVHRANRPAESAAASSTQLLAR
jgi:nucleotide-binding universal stress UspA family protein